MSHQFVGAFDYFLAHRTEFWTELIRHVQLSACASLAAFCIGFPSGALATRGRRLGDAAMQVALGMRVVPSLATLFVCVPIFGLGFLSSTIALTLLAIPPIALATDAAYRSADHDAVEAATGVGMTRWQTFWRVRTPLAAPLIIGGVKTATVEVIGSASLAAFVGGGGLGAFVVRGFSLYDPAIMMVGAIPIAALALVGDCMFDVCRKFFTGKRSP
jgi:osmoprotectant transport system permease protein